MNVLRHTDTGFTSKLERLMRASSLFDPEIEQRVRGILEDVRARGDVALLEFAERFDAVKLTTEQLTVSRAELFNAALAVEDPLRAAMTLAEKNITAFARGSLRKNWSRRNAQGGKVGEKFDPFQRVGIYVPGGKAPLASTALMTITLARAAGCHEIIVCTPCGKDGNVNPALLHAARMAGATEIYKVGGAQAIAAMALGTATIRRVQKIFGPGNAYVVAAKRLLFGQVAMDLLPGPSEVLVIADDTANARFAAADLLAQAEHGSGHERVWLVTPSLKMLRAVEREIAKQLSKRSRREFIGKVLAENGWLIHVKSVDQGIDITNRLAPEHCEVMTRRARQISERIVTAGAIFLGNNSPTVLGDYVAGPSHTLPTGGAGASFAGLTVDQFQRRTSVVEYSAAALKKSLAAVEQFAAIEGLEAHGQSAAIRLEGK